MEIKITTINTSNCLIININIKISQNPKLTYYHYTMSPFVYCSASVMEIKINFRYYNDFI